MKRIKIGVIGLGYWGPNLVRNFRKIPGVEIILAADLKKENLKKIHIDFPSIKTTNEYKKILKDESIDAVVIATEVKSHYRLVKETLSSGKHVLVEKPMTKTSNEAKELIALSKNRKKLLMVGHTFVYSNAVRKIKEIITSNDLGTIYYYDSMRINLGLIQKDSNVIWDLAPHDLSILNYILKQKPLTLAAFGSSHLHYSHEEMAHVFITYENNITAHIHVSWLSPVKIRTVLIGGSKKMIVYDDINPSEKIKIYDKGVLLSRSKVTPFSPAYRSGNVVIPQIDQAEPLYNEVYHFIDCIRNNKKPITDGEAGLEVVSLLEATDRALQTKREVHFHE